MGLPVSILRESVFPVSEYLRRVSGVLSILGMSVGFPVSILGGSVGLPVSEYLRRVSGAPH